LGRKPPHKNVPNVPMPCKRLRLTVSKVRRLRLANVSGTPSERSVYRPHAAASASRHAVERFAHLTHAVGMMRRFSTCSLKCQTNKKSAPTPSDFGGSSWCALQYRGSVSEYSEVCAGVCAVLVGKCHRTPATPTLSTKIPWWCTSHTEPVTHQTVYLTMRRRGPPPSLACPVVTLWLRPSGGRNRGRSRLAPTGMGQDTILIHLRVQKGGRKGVELLGSPALRPTRRCRVRAASPRSAAHARCATSHLTGQVSTPEHLSM
jgi:hypothetical protein